MTPLQVQNRAASDLGILRLGQALRPEDLTRIEAAYDEVYAQLKKEGLTSWTDDVPDAVVPFVVSLICENCLGTYGVSPERYQRIVNVSTTAKVKIREQVNPAHVSMSDPEDF